MNVERESVPGFRAGSGTVGTTAAPLAETTVQVLKYVVVRADSGNANVVKIGSTSGEAENGFVLAAGQQSPPIYVDDLMKVWVIGGAAGQKYSWIAF